MSEQTEAMQLAKLWAAGKMAGGDSYKVASVLAKQVEALQAENEELRKDAERYQWLRSNIDRDIGAYETPIVRVSHDYDYANSYDIDAQIDAAIAKQK